MEHKHRRAATISIHALREEGDLLWEHFENLMGQFLSTPSARRATKQTNVAGELSGISIHALREEGDLD